VLVLGSTGHANVTAVSWEEKLPNIVDFHLCIIVVKTISDEFLKRKDSRYFDAISLQLRRLLLSKGKVIILGDTFRRIDKPKSHPDSASNYDWCPFAITFTREQGDTVQLGGTRFSGYLGKLKRWSFHYACSAIDRDWRNSLDEYERYNVSTASLATNREGKLLAGCHKVEIHQAHRVSAGYEMVTRWPENPTRITGELVFLSPLQDVDERETVALLLSDLGLKEDTPPPQWVEKIEVPGVEDLTDVISLFDRDIKSLQDAKTKKDLELQRLRRWARLLYATGGELEDIFRESLEALGGTVKAAKYASEEYILQTSAGEILVEVKGNTKSVSLDDVRQLVEYTLHYQRDTRKEGKGVLFGNAWRLIPPDERDTKDKPYFPDDVKRSAARFGIALVSSKAYFAAFCRFLKGEVKGGEILEKLAKADGVVSF
jgi:hypothetical protein